MAERSVAPADAGNNLGQSEFLRLMLTQLRYQDPTKPTDNQAFIAQMAQFSALAQTQQINQGVGSLVGYQASQQSIGLLNRSITFENADKTLASGTVKRIAFDKEEPTLTVELNGSGGITVTATMGQVRSVSPGP